MSHMTLEYSANLRGDGNFGELCASWPFMCALDVDGRRCSAAACGACARLRGLLHRGRLAATRIRACRAQDRRRPAPPRSRRRAPGYSIS